MTRKNKYGKREKSLIKAKRTNAPNHNLQRNEHKGTGMFVQSSVLYFWASCLFFLHFLFLPQGKAPLNKIFLRPLNKVNGALHNGIPPICSELFNFFKFLLEAEF